MKKLILAIILLFAWPACAVQTFIPAGGLVITTSSTTTVLSQAFTVTSSAQSFFVLTNLLVTNEGGHERQLTIIFDEASSAFPSCSITVDVPPGATFTYQVPKTVTALAAGPYTVRVKVIAQSPNTFVLHPDSYLGVFEPSVPSGVIVQLNGQSGASQTFAVSSPETDFVINSSSNVHTFSLHLLGAGAQSIRLGNGAVAAQTGDTAIGTSAQANGGNAVALGINALAEAVGAIGIGEGLTNSGQNNVAIGDLYDVSGTEVVAIGGGVVAGGDQTTCIGATSQCDGDHGTSLGYGNIPGVHSIALGSANDCSAAGSICVGDGGQSVVAGELLLGGPLTPITNAYLGNGKTDSSPSNVVLQPTNRSGTNVTGKIFTLRGGKGAGSGSTGDIHLDVCPGGGAGITPNTCSSNVGWIIHAPTGNLIPNATTETIGESGSQVPVIWVTDIKSATGFRTTESFPLNATAVDGVQCVKADTALASMPKVPTITCADNGAGIVAGVWTAPDGWSAGAIDFELVGVNTNAAPSGVTGFDVSCRCTSDGDLLSSTFGSAGNADQTWTTQDVQEQWGATVTCAGSCAAGDTVYWKIVVDATATTTTQTADVFLAGVKIEYVRGPILSD